MTEHEKATNVEFVVQYLSVTLRLVLSAEKLNISISSYRQHVVDYRTRDHICSVDEQERATALASEHDGCDAAKLFARA